MFRRHPARSRLARRGPREQGVILILTLFVILITYALVTQLTLTSSVAYQTAQNQANRLRMQTACMSAAEQILETLANDSSSGEGGGFGGNDFGGDGSGGDGGFADGMNDTGYTGDSGGDQEGDEGGESDDGSNSDSFEDDWARPMRIVMSDIEITAWVQDENGKFNLHALIAEDEEYREQARDRCARILDELREDYPDHDLSSFDAERLVDRIVEWMEGPGRTDDTGEYPRPLRHSNPEEEETTLMFALEELMVLEDIGEFLFYDQYLPLDEGIALGLESVFTVWTTFAMAPPGSEGPTPGQAPGGGEDQPDSGGVGENEGDETGGPDLGGQEGAEAGDDEPDPDRLTSSQDTGRQEPEIGAVMNLNTMAKPVLKGLLPPEEFSSTVVEEILEYRNEVDQDALAEIEEAVDDDTYELERALYGEDRPDPKLYFKSLQDLEKIESLENTVDAAVRDQFLELIGVQSEVFSVYLFARIKPEGWQPVKRYDEPPGPVLRMRAVVWRRPGQDGADFVYLMPWHEVPKTRWRVPDFPDREELFAAPESFF